MQRYFTATILGLLLSLSCLRAADDAMSAADAVLHSGNHVKALELYRKIYLADSLNTTALYNAGYCYKMLAKVDSAIPLFTRVLVLNPSIMNAHLALAECYTSKKSFGRSAEHLTKYLSYDSSKILVYFNRAIAFFALDKRREAYNDAMRCHRSVLSKAVQEKVELMLSILGDRDPNAETRVYADDSALVKMKLPRDWYV